jgi:IS4 transposase
MGLTSLSRNNLSNSLAKRSSEVFERTFYWLLDKVQHDIKEKKDRRFKFKKQIKAIDSTTISLCMSLFTWASYRKTKSGIKVHAIYDIKNQIPEFIHITDARRHDHIAVSRMPIQENAIYALDRAYLCFKTLENIDKNRAFFVTRIKSNTQYKKISCKKPKGTGVLRDDRIVFTGNKANDYPHEIRLVRFKDKEENKVYTFLTNNFELSARTIADIYRSRWDIELFFKWIKQNLRIRSFIGTSENAVRIQIWTAAITYLLVEYIRLLSKTVFSRIEVLRILSTHIMSNIAIGSLLTKRKPNSHSRCASLDLQLDLCF